MTDQWPIELVGITEAVVTTRGPNERWNVAALGLIADDPVTARTWGRTRTRRNFESEASGYVQFVSDPVTFVDAACSVREEETPILRRADAWVHVECEAIDRGIEQGTEWVEWELSPTDAEIERETVPTTNRGYYAVIEATVAASRLDVAGYDRSVLLDRIEYFERVAERCGGPREQAAFDRFHEYVDIESESE